MKKYFLSILVIISLKILLICDINEGINNSYSNNLRSGINILVGIFLKTNKCTGWNNRTCGKIELKYCLIIPILVVNFLLSLEI